MNLNVSISIFGAVVAVAIVKAVLDWAKDKNTRSKNQGYQEGFICPVCCFTKKKPDDLCPCCGNELSTFEPNKTSDLSILRNKFIDHGMKFKDKKHMPAGWDFSEQIRHWGLLSKWFGKEKEYYEYFRQNFKEAAKKAGYDKYYVLDMFDDGAIGIAEIETQSGTMIVPDGDIFKFDFFYYEPSRTYALEIFKKIERNEINDKQYYEAMDYFKKERKEITWHEDIIDYINQY